MVKELGTDYSFDGPHKIDNKEDRMLEAFFLSRRLDEVPHRPVTKSKQPREEVIE